MAVGDRWICRVCWTSNHPQSDACWHCGTTRDREPWAFIVGLALAVVGGIGSVVAFDTFLPGLINQTAVRWGSIVVFGGAGMAAAAGLVLMSLRREQAA